MVWKPSVPTSIQSEVLFLRLLLEVRPSSRDLFWVSVVKVVVSIEPPRTPPTTTFVPLESRLVPVVFRDTLIPPQPKLLRVPLYTDLPRVSRWSPTGPSSALGSSAETQSGSTTGTFGWFLLPAPDPQTVLGARVLLLLLPLEPGTEDAEPTESSTVLLRPLRFLSRSEFFPP